MNDEEIQQVFIDTDALLSGHFALTSGKHSNKYVQCARVLEYPGITTRLAKETADRLPKEIEADMVIAPAVGGIIFGFAMAQALDLPFVFAEREQGKMALRRAFQIPKDARVIVAEDVVTTGGSVKEVCDIVEVAGAEVVAVVSLIDRGADRKFTAPFFPLLTLGVEAWDVDDCELCKQEVELYSPGSRSLKN